MLDLDAVGKARMAESAAKIEYDRQLSDEIRELVENTPLEKLNTLTIENFSNELELLRKVYAEKQAMAAEAFDAWKISQNQTVQPKDHNATPIIAKLKEAEVDKLDNEIEEGSWSKRKERKGGRRTRGRKSRTRRRHRKSRSTRRR
jgi:hypothetical protein